MCEGCATTPEKQNELGHMDTRCECIQSMQRVGRGESPPTALCAATMRLSTSSFDLLTASRRRSSSLTADTHGTTATEPSINITCWTRERHVRGSDLEHNAQPRHVTGPSVGAEAAHAATHTCAHIHSTCTHTHTHTQARTHAGHPCTGAHTHTHSAPPPPLFPSLLRTTHPAPQRRQARRTTHHGLQRRQIVGSPALVRVLGCDFGGELVQATL
jgi:hypothetical protein